MDISRITLQTEDIAVTIEKETDGTWTDLLAMFMKALEAHGFKPGNFYYDGEEVVRDKDFEDVFNDDIID